MNSNRDVYNSKLLLAWYGQLESVMEAERKTFEEYADLIKRSSVLDIGIGGGRTTQLIANNCLAYTGIDFSLGFTQLVKEKYPALDIRTMDARNLSDFKNNQFDFVNFSFNGMDYVDLEGRKKVFTEINRVLKPGGLFFFSTHNKSHHQFRKHAWNDPSLSFTVKVKTFLRLLPFQLRHLVNKKNEIYKDNYAIINDAAHNYSLFTFYTTPPFLEEQLMQFNFSEIKFMTKSGDQVPKEKLDDWIFTTCKKSF